MDDEAAIKHKNLSHNDYALNGKIMLCSVVILFTLVIVILCSHSYARWRFHLRRHRSRRRAHDLFSTLFTATTTTASGSVSSQSLDLAVLKTIPTFVYSSTTHDPLLACAVCLSEFENDEKGRVLPKCNHSFHSDCIDMWFQSHSNCPLCRGPVEPYISFHTSEISTESVSTVLNLADTVPESGSETGFLAPSSTGSLSPVMGCRRKPLELVGILVEMPTRDHERFRALEEIEVGFSRKKRAQVSW